MRRRGPFTTSRVCVALACVALGASARAQEPAARSTPPAGTADGAPPGPAAPRTVTLDDALRIAREHQPQLLAARAGTTAAVARADQALSALLPQVAATGSYERSTMNFALRPGLLPSSFKASSSSSWATTDYWTFGATASQLVYDFGQTPGHWHASQALASSQRGTERATLLQVLLGVRTTYFTARAGKDLVKVASDTLVNQEAHLRQIEGFVRVGTRPDIDLAQARTDRANAEVQLINAQNAYLTAKAQLNQAMGLVQDTDYEVADEVLPPVRGEDQPIDALVAEALKGRPDVTALEEQSRAQRLTLGAVRGAYAPSLGVSTGMNDAGPTLDNMAWNWNATVTLTWNLFQGGLTRAQEQEARANIDAAEAQLETLRQQVRVDLEQARLSVRAARSALVAAGEALTNAQLQLKLAERRYTTGVGNVIELGDAQVALTAAAAQRVQAQYNLSSSRAQLLRALGREDDSTPR